MALDRSRSNRSCSIGRELIEQGLEQLQKLGAVGCVVLGETEDDEGNPRYCRVRCVC